MDNADSPEAEPEQPPSEAVPKPLFREAKQVADEEEATSLGKNWIESVWSVSLILRCTVKT